MKQALQIRFVGMEPSAALELPIRRAVAKLEGFHPHLMSCRVTVEELDKHKHQGRQHAVRIDLTVPGAELCVDHVRHEDVRLAVRDAFADLRRQLQDVVRRTQGHVKVHPVEESGEIVRFDIEGRYGFIRSDDGEEYWFGPDNVVDGRFDQLLPGTEVRFVPEFAAEGRQAKRVNLGHHHVG
ncbi:MAG TPA: HPF/RaiA family ribosome-associated protein [Burkholderiaceae bacterium]